MILTTFGSIASVCAFVDHRFVRKLRSASEPVVGDECKSEYSCLTTRLVVPDPCMFKDNPFLNIRKVVHPVYEGIVISNLKASMSPQEGPSSTINEVARIFSQNSKIELTNLSDKFQDDNNLEVVYEPAKTETNHFSFSLGMSGFDVTNAKLVGHRTYTHGTPHSDSFYLIVGYFDGKVFVPDSTTVRKNMTKNDVIGEWAFRRNMWGLTGALFFTGAAYARSKGY